MPNCWNCGAFNWDDQINCTSCGVDLFPTEEKEPPTSGFQKPDSEPGRTRVGARRGFQPAADDGPPPPPAPDQAESLLAKRTPIGRRRIGNDVEDFDMLARGARHRHGTAAFSFGEIFVESGRVIKNNPIILVPSLIPAIWSVVAPIAGVVGFSGLFDLVGDDASIVTVVIGFLLFMLLTFLIFVWAHAATVRMFATASEKSGSALFIDGWETAFERTFALLIGGVIAGIAIGVGMMLLVIPGLIALLLFFLFVQAIMVDDEGPISSLTKSGDVVKINFGGAVLILLATVVIPVMIELQSTILSSLPLWAIWGNILVALATLIAQVYVTGLATIFYLSRR